MQIGIGIPSFASDHSRIPTRRLINYCQQAEAEGFAGAWVLDHVHPPSLYTTSWFDPLTTLATVAGVTETIPLGTSIVILPLRDPVMEARRAATVHDLSEGRLTLGVGLGSDRAEYEIRGVDWETRSSRLSEQVELVHRLFNEDRVTHEGEHFAVDDFRLEPHSVRPPTLLAGGSGVKRDDGVRRMARRVKDRVLAADGWVGAPWRPEAIESDWNDIVEHAEANDHDPDDLERRVVNYVHLVPDADTETALEEQRRVFDGFVRPGGLDFAERHYLTGSLDDIRADLAAYEETGIQETVLHPVVTDPAALDRQLRLMADEIRPEFR